LIDFICALNL